MEKRKNILFVSHETEVNGSSLSLISLIKGLELIDNSIEITILIPFTFGKDKQALKLAKENQINVKQALYRNNYKKVNGKQTFKCQVFDICNFFAVGRIGRYIKRKKFDIVCSNSSAVDVGARAAFWSKKPHIYYIREFMEEDHGIEYRNKDRMKKLLELSEYVIFISKSVEKKYKSLYQLKNTIQFYNGFIIENYKIYNHYILNKERIDLIQVGTFCDGKGTLNSIKLIFELIKKGILNVHLEFVGNGEESYIEAMNKLINKCNLENYITISPYTNNIKIKLSKADVLLMNSCSEGFGRVTVEGMLAGCLILGRDSAGTTEIVRHNINGLLYHDNKSFLECVDKILNSREYCRSIAQAGQKRACNEFDYYKVAQKFLKFISPVYI